MDMIREHDDHIMKVLLSVTSLTRSERNKSGADVRFFLPTSMSGFGVTKMEDVALPSFVSTFTQIAAVLREIRPGFYEHWLECDTTWSGTVSSAFRDLQSVVPDAPGLAETLSSTPVKLGSLVLPIYDARIDLPREKVPPNIFSIIESMASPCSMSWLCALPVIPSLQGCS